jgi:hypothetical protein
MVNGFIVLSFSHPLSYAAKCELVAMVIAHEMLHAVGYTHPERGSVAESTYLDTFMVKFANCISVTALPSPLGELSKVSGAD